MLRISLKLATGVAASLALTGAAIPAMASDDSIGTINHDIVAVGDIGTVSNETVDLMWKIAESPDAFTAEQSGAVSLAVSGETLQHSYGFSANEVTQLRDALTNQHRGATTTERLAASPNSQASARAESGVRILYMDTEFLTAGAGAALYAAAQAGPVALTAAWTAFTAALSGPIAIGAAVLGGAFFADLAVKIVGAVVQKKGVAVYADWGIPPLRTVIE